MEAKLSLNGLVLLTESFMTEENSFFRPDGQIEYYESIDHILEVHINDYRIRDIITQTIVLDRAL